LRDRLFDECSGTFVVRDSLSEEGPASSG
jgi:hypothetical protein